MIASPDSTLSPSAFSQETTFPSLIVDESAGMSSLLNSQSGSAALNRACQIVIAGESSQRSLRQNDISPPEGSITSILSSAIEEALPETPPSAMA